MRFGNSCFCLRTKRFMIIFKVLAITLTVFITNIFSLVFAEEFRYDSHGKRDPFSLPKSGVKKKIVARSSGSLTSLRLEGVVVDPGGQSLAIVNGEMVSEGDKIGDLITVYKIYRSGVDFLANGKLINIAIEHTED